MKKILAITLLVCMLCMHNEKNIEYALKGYFYSLDELIETTGVGLDLNNVYDNIEKTTVYAAESA